MPCCASSPTACATCSTRNRSGRTNAARSNRKCCATSPRRAAISSATRRAIAFAGTPYAHDGVGTRAAFDRLTGPADQGVLRALVRAQQRRARDRRRRRSERGARAGARALRQRSRAATGPRARGGAFRAAEAHGDPAPDLARLSARGRRLPHAGPRQSRTFSPRSCCRACSSAQRGPLHALADDGRSARRRVGFAALRPRSAARLRDRGARAGRRSRRDDQAARSDRARYARARRSAGTVRVDEAAPDRGSRAQPQFDRSAGLGLGRRRSRSTASRRSRANKS